MDIVNGSKIRKLREAKGYSQEKLGDLIDVTKSSISQYENDKKDPTFEKTKKLADALHTTPYYLMDMESIVKVREDDEEYEAVFSEYDVKIIREIKKHKVLYDKLCDDPKNLIDRIMRTFF